VKVGFHGNEAGLGEEEGLTRRVVWQEYAVMTSDSSDSVDAHQHAITPTTHQQHANNTATPHQQHANMLTTLATTHQ